MYRHKIIGFYVKSQRVDAVRDNSPPFPPIYFPVPASPLSPPNPSTHNLDNSSLDVSTVVVPLYRLHQTTDTPQHALYASALSQHYCSV